MTARYIDTHAHIQGEDYAEDVDAVVQRAIDAGVDRLIVPGIDAASSREAIALAEAHDGVFATAGYHPHEAALMDDEAFAAAEEMLTHPGVVAVGEIGLDYFYEHSPRDTQLSCIERMLELAGAHQLPVIVHCRDAWEDMQDVLGAWSARVRPSFDGQALGVMHYFSGTPDQGRFFIDQGFLISIHTSVTHKKQEGMRQAAAELPLESLVIETDSPYGAPQVVRGKRNEPVYVVEAAKQIAAAKSVALDEVAAVTSANAERLFRLPVRHGARL